MPPKRRAPAAPVRVLPALPPAATARVLRWLGVLGGGPDAASVLAPLRLLSRAFARAAIDARVQRCWAVRLPALPAPEGRTRIEPLLQVLPAPWDRGLRVIEHGRHYRAWDDAVQSGDVVAVRWLLADGGDAPGCRGVLERAVNMCTNAITGRARRRAHGNSHDDDDDDRVQRVHDVLRVLVSAGAPGPDKALRHAVEALSIDTVRVLVEECGVEVPRDVLAQVDLLSFKYGCDWSEASVVEEVLRLLVRHGADINVEISAPAGCGDDDRGPYGATQPMPRQQSATLMHFLVSQPLRHKTAIVRKVLELGFSLGPCGAMSTTLLHAAAAAVDYETIKVLLKRGADVNARDALGQTPLHAACDAPSWRYRGGECTRVVRQLLRNGADARARNIAHVTPQQLLQGGCKETAAVCVLLTRAAGKS